LPALTNGKGVASDVGPLLPAITRPVKPVLRHSIDRCPPLEPDTGDGRMLVASTYKRLATDVLHLAIVDEEQPTGGWGRSAAEPPAEG